MFNLHPFLLKHEYLIYEKLRQTEMNQNSLILDLIIMKLELQTRFGLRSANNTKSLKTENCFKFSFLSNYIVSVLMTSAQH